ncbi:MAG: hypothetical protein HY055_12755 [Magnetospirillum sp.]|nr:hypothetical protein [Magnetospirillum sp.]
MRLLSLQLGSQSASFVHTGEVARDYGLSVDGAGGQIRRFVDILDLSNTSMDKAREVVRAYGFDLAAYASQSDGAIRLMDDFAHALTGVRDGLNKTHDVLTVMGPVGVETFDAIARGAGSASHAVTEHDRNMRLLAEQISQSQAKIADAAKDTESWYSAIIRRLGEFASLNAEAKDRQLAAWAEIKMALAEHKGGIESLTGAWERAAAAVTVYFRNAAQQTVFGDMVAGPLDVREEQLQQIVLKIEELKKLQRDSDFDWQKSQYQSMIDAEEAKFEAVRASMHRIVDGRPDSPTRRDTYAEPLAKSDSDGGAAQDIAAEQKKLQAKLLLKENWLRQDHALEVEHWQTAKADALANGLEENSVYVTLVNERLAQAQRAEAQYQAGRGQQAASVAEQASEEERAAQLRGLEMQSRAAEKGSMERVRAVGEEVSYAFTAWGAMSAQYKAAMDRLLQADRDYDTEQREIAKIRSDGDAEVSRIRLQIEKDRLDAEVSAGLITQSEKIAALRVLTDAANAEALRRLDVEIASLEKGTKAWEEHMAKRRALSASQEENSAKLDAQAAEASRKAADKAGDAWVSAFAPAGRAADSMLQGIFQGTQTLGQASARAFSNMALSYGESLGAMGLKFLAFKAAQALGWTEMATGIQNSIKSGTFGWILGEQQKTAATVAGNAQRTTATTAAQSSQTAATVTGTAARTAAEEGSEAVRTGVVVAGVAERTAAQETGAAVEKVTATSSIMVKAGDAAASVYDEVAQIPYVGWLLAPPAAAAAYAGVAAFSMFSAEGGWDRVPYDGAATVLHQNEMVLSARYANPLRDLLEAPQVAYGMPSLGLGPDAVAGMTQAASGSGQDNAAAAGPVTVNAPMTVNATTNMSPEQFQAALDRHSHSVARAADKGRRGFARDKR